MRKVLLKKSFTVIKWLACLACFVGFGKTVYEALIHATSGKTTMSFDIHEHPEGLDPPALTVCNKTGFKNIDKNLRLEDYLANTIDLETIFKGARNYHNRHTYNLSRIKMSTMYTTYRGRCYTFNFDFKVLKRDCIQGSWIPSMYFYCSLLRCTLWNCLSQTMWI